MIFLWTLIKKCSYFVPMQKHAVKQEPAATYMSCQGIGNKPLSHFPEAWVALTCCNGEHLIHVSELLKNKMHRDQSVATAISSLRCIDCGKEPQTAYLQETPHRKGSLSCNPGWACEVR